MSDEKNTNTKKEEARKSSEELLTLAKKQTEAKQWNEAKETLDQLVSNITLVRRRVASMAQKSDFSDLLG